MKTIISILFFFTFLSVFSQESNTYIISSGSKGGNYYNTGEYIAKKLQESTNHKFVNIESEGSVNNISLLKENLADFAIVQRNTLLESYYDEVNGINNIEIIAPLFIEKFIIYYNSYNEINLEDLKKRIENETIKMGFTSKSSYSYKIFQILVQYHKINKSNIIEVYDNYDNLTELLIDKKIDALVSFSLPLLKIEESPKIRKVGFKEDELDIIEAREPNLFIVEEKENNSKTLGSWTFLIGSKEFVTKNSQFNIPDLLYKMDQDDYYGNIISQSIDYFNKQENAGKEFLKGLPLSDNLVEMIKYKPLKYKGLYLILVLFGMVLLLILFLQNINHLGFFDVKYLSFRYRHIIIGLLILIGIYFVSIEVMLLAEQNFYKKMALKSQLLNMSYEELNKWLIFKKLNGDDMGIYPYSLLGKIMLTITTYSIFLGTLFIVIFEYITYKLIIKRKNGLMDIKFENHIVLTGWNDSTHNFIKEAIELNNKESAQSKIVCIVKDPNEVLTKHKTMELFHNQKKIYFVNGDVKDSKTLLQANIHKAKTVVLFAEDTTIYADEITLLRALSIYRFCDEKFEDERSRVKLNSNVETYDMDHFVNPVYVIAEINDIKFRRLLVDADVNEVIVTSNLTKNIITQSMYHHSISKIMDEILHYNENDFYILDLLLEKNKKLRNKTFDELFVPLRQLDLLLIGIKVVFRDVYGTEITNENEILKLLKQEKAGKNIKRDILINPITKEEKERRTDQDDQLIVFAQDLKSVENAIKKLKI